MCLAGKGELVIAMICKTKIFLCCLVPSSLFDLELKPYQHLSIFTLALNTPYEMAMLALLPEFGIREARRVKAI